MVLSCGLFLRNPDCPELVFIHHNCSNNTCDDGIFCNGFEMCTDNAGCHECNPGTPVDCGSGFFCDEDEMACVAINSEESGNDLG